MRLERGQIVWVDFTPQRGHEQAGRRPAVVISPADYNALSSCVLVCPITSNLSPWPWKVALQDEQPITGAILVDQVKSIDVEARHIELSGQQVSSALMDEVLARLETITA